MTVLVRADARRLPFADGVAHNDIDFAPALCLYAGVSQSRDSRGRIKPGVRFSPATEFQPGQHWRKPQAFRDAEWLRREYVDKQRSTGEIAAEFGPFGTREHRAALWNLVLLCNVCHRWVHSPANTERRFLRTAEEMAA